MDSVIDKNANSVLSPKYMHFGIEWVNNAVLCRLIYVLKLHQYILLN